MNNQKGYTLILVMIIIMVTMILGIALTSATINAGKQFSKTDDHNKATDLAEMGVTYYLSVNNSLINLVQASDANNPLSNFCTDFTKLLNNNSNGYYSPIIVEGQNSYQIAFDPSRTTSCSSNPNSINIGFKSIGSTGSEPPVTLTGTFKIVNNASSGNSLLLSGFLASILSTPLPSNIVNYGDLKTNQKGNSVITTPSYFNSITLQGQGTYTINNDAYIQNSISVNGQSVLTVRGDVIFGNNNPIDKKTNKANICITGNTYYVTSNGTLANLDISAQNNCSNTNSQNNWSINPINGITVTYTN